VLGTGQPSCLLALRLPAARGECRSRRAGKRRAQTAMASGVPRTRVYFRYAGDRVGPGEEVRVVGDCEELGNWKPAAGVALRPDAVEQQCFTSKAVALPIGKQVQYKYVVCSRTSDACRWELQEENRTVVPTGQRLLVEDDRGRYRHVEYGKPRPHKPPSAGDACSECIVAESLTSMPRLQSFEKKLKKDKETQVGAEDTVFAVFRTLPVRLERSSAGEWIAEADRDSEQFNFKVVSMMARSLPEDLIKSVKFVGHPGVFTADPEEQRKITEVLAPLNCIPVFLDEQVATLTLEFCHRFLWPVMHNMKVFDDNVKAHDQDNRNHHKFDEVQWRTYQVFNRTYAEAVEAAMSPDSKPLVWVHDFYLLLLPRALSLRCPWATIGLYLHCAFPSSEVFRCISPREEILQSMLSSKIITFQIFEYARHFLSCCQLLLNATYYFQGAGVLCIDHDSESVIVRTDHFVIPFLDLVERMNNTTISQQAKAIQQQFGDKLIFASIDGDEPFAGIVHKFRAFQRFMNECQHAHRVGLYQHILARRQDDGQKESEIVTEVKRLADEINKAHGRPGQPAVIVRMGEVTVDERLSILHAANVLFDTSINDGLNLHPFLFCVAHSKDQKGSMIISEFCGCSSVLTGARKVNPYNTQATVDALHAAYMQDAEARSGGSLESKEYTRKFKTDISYVSTQRLSNWVRTNLSELKQAASKQSGPVKGLGAGCKVLSMERGYRHLPEEAVLHHYRESKSRVILLDNEGTLAPDRRSVIRPYGAQDTLDRIGCDPDPQVLECLQALCDDRSNTVVVVSGRSKSLCDKWFGQVKDLGMCAEHGFYWVPAGKGKQRPGVNRWLSMQEHAHSEDDDWKRIAATLMQQYVKRVQGSVLEAKGSAVAWNYRKVGAQVLANEIALQLTRFLDPTNGPESLMYGYPVVVVNGKGYVEVKRSDVDKGVAADRVLAEVKERVGHVDFVLCIGDDRSDEDMFEVVNLSAKREGLESIAEEPIPADSPKALTPSIWSSSGPGLRIGRKGSLTLEEFNPADMADSSRYYTVTVGRKPSKAGYFLKDVQEVSDLLQKLAIQARAAGLQRFSSMPMLVRPEDADSD